MRGNEQGEKHFHRIDEEVQVGTGKKIVVQITIFFDGKNWEHYFFVRPNEV
jgi:hypothetical protein